MIREKYSWKLKKDHILIISYGFSYVPVVLKVKIFKLNEYETKLTATFQRSLVLRLIIWILSLTMFLLSLLYIFGILIGDISVKETPMLTIGLPFLVLVVSISYLLYTEITRNKEKEKLVIMLNNIFTKYDKNLAIINLVLCYR